MSENEKIKVSIIMPVYNVEKFLEKTFQSVIDQTFKDFELLVVDDGATDSSGKICDEYAQKDNRIQVFHKKNGGAPEARNVAIEKAKGKYIYCMDSDDWIEKEYIEKMYNLAEENNADIVITGFLMEYFQNGKEVTYKTDVEDKVYKNKEEFRNNAYKYFNNSFLSLACNKLLKREIIMSNNIRFPNTKWDDHHFNMEYLKDVNVVVISSIAMYHWYRSREGSETMINYSDVNMFEKRLEHYEHVKKLYNYWGVNDKESVDGISCYFIGRVFQCIQELADNKKITYKEKRDKVKIILENENTQEGLKNAKSLSTKFKILTIPMKCKNVTMSLLFGSIVSFVRKCLPGLFIKIKEKEVHGK